ncbi:hypothetical protein VFPPC_17655 [Pochonia chlamydosporia 170]|uniref:Uncharacterized protein n=1 Tax=Pochonia chlamydosporia 170 TaxID=1380566 RepID=A0A219ARE2_METCM|nr:hypothetical protein VFPPC_17655 [Pochonia chlamydosporia 170]OWT43169.1 hypothetical protein VFPPC_17655 [Pochonia chlamydosporia 170]
MELEALTSFVEEIFKLPLSVPWSLVSIGEDHMLAGLDLRRGSETMCLADFSRTALWTLSALPNTGQAGKSRSGNAYAGRQSLYECTQAIYSRSKLESPRLGADTSMFAQARANLSKAKFVERGSWFPVHSRFCVFPAFTFTTTWRPQVVEDF